MTVRTLPTDARSACRRPRTSEPDRFGTFRLSIIGPGALASQRVNGAAKWVAVDQIRSPSADGRTSRLTARPDRPNRAPAITAPMVPENRVDRPVFGPKFTPASTRSGGSPNPPIIANITMSAGGAPTE